MVVVLHESRTTIAWQQNLLTELMSGMSIQFQYSVEDIEAVETVKGITSGLMTTCYVFGGLMLI